LRNRRDATACCAAFSRDMARRRCCISALNFAYVCIAVRRRRCGPAFVQTISFRGEHWRGAGRGVLQHAAFTWRRVFFTEKKSRLSDWRRQTLRTFMHGSVVPLSLRNISLLLPLAASFPPPRYEQRHRRFGRRYHRCCYAVPPALHLFTASRATYPPVPPPPLPRRAYLLLPPLQRLAPAACTPPSPSLLPFPAYCYTAFSILLARQWWWRTERGGALLPRRAAAGHTAARRRRFTAPLR